VVGTSPSIPIGIIKVSTTWEAKRRAVDNLHGADFEPGVAQNWAHFFVSQKSDESNLLKRNGEPPRTRTWNPLIGCSGVKYMWFQAVSHFGVSTNQQISA